MANIKENKRFHFTYKTTNLKNGRYYLGMHSTNRIDDGYLGSGKRLYYELNKYGRDNFKFEILKQFDSREQLVEAEINLITEHDLKNPNCLNLKQGGSGGWTDSMREKAKVSAKSFMQERWKDQEYRNKMLSLRNNPTRIEEHNTKVSSTLQEYYKNIPGTFLGKHHTEETKQKIGESNSNRQRGESNSQYGTCWITNEIESKKVYKTDPIPEGWRLGRKIKKCVCSVIGNTLASKPKIEGS
jgi:hypothetical protein